MSNVINIKSLSKVRKHADSSFELLIDDLEIEHGDFIGLIGASGCGKSTLLDILALVLSPTNAERFDYTFKNGNELNVMQLWTENKTDALATIRGFNLGYVLQSGGLLPFLTVLENVLLPFEIKAKEIDLDKIEKIAKELDILDLFSKKPSFLSGGQRQRAAILRALSHQPSLILADEPTAAVDQERAMIIVKKMKDIVKEYNTTIIMVSHDLNLVEAHVDKLYKLTAEIENEHTVVSKLDRHG